MIDTDRIPRHIAIIMDGNGRWAEARGQNRSKGHQAGAESVDKITAECARLGVKYLTLYTFSTENWNRPPAEVEAIMQLLLSNLVEETFMKNNVRLRIIGDRSRVAPHVMKAIEAMEERTAGNDRMTLVLAFSYSSRWEITDAVKKISQKVASGALKAEEITDETVSAHLTTAHMPDPDLLIRTGGDKRISNFLLWQIAYSEIYITDKYWPDFSKEDFCQAIIEYQSRERRFGLTSEQLK